MVCVCARGAILRKMTPAAYRVLERSSSRSSIISKALCSSNNVSNVFLYKSGKQAVVSLRLFQAPGVALCAQNDDPVWVLFGITQLSSQRCACLSSEEKRPRPGETRSKIRRATAASNQNPPCLPPIQRSSSHDGSDASDACQSQADRAEDCVSKTGVIGPGLARRGVFVTRAGWSDAGLNSRSHRLEISYVRPAARDGQHRDKATGDRRQAPHRTAPAPHDIGHRAARVCRSAEMRTARCFRSRCRATISRLGSSSSE